MWLSCSSFFQQFFHCHCPVRFGRKADPNGDYIRWVWNIGSHIIFNPLLTFYSSIFCPVRRYLPVLKNFPTRYIHEPWNAPMSVQRAAKCIIGRDYCLPMVNHSKSSRINIERMKHVYHNLNKYRENGKYRSYKFYHLLLLFHRRIRFLKLLLFLNIFYKQGW